LIVSFPASVIFFAHLEEAVYSKAVMPLTAPAPRFSVVTLLARGVPASPEHPEAHLLESDYQKQGLQPEDLIDRFLTSQERTLFYIWVPYTIGECSAYFPSYMFLR
jgi:hypothetical protein